MKIWILLAILAIALFTLAVGGWVVRGVRSVVRPPGRLVPAPA